MVPQTINVGMIIPCTEAEGPGKRFAVWVQGCPMRCKGCCNPEYLEFEDKRVMTVDQIMKMVLEAKSSHGVEGVTLLGGEPFSQAAALATLAGRVKKASMSVMVFSGFTKAALDKMAAPGVAELLAATDLLVDGPFMQDRLDKRRRWIGSQNQEAYALTPVYEGLVEEWDTSPNTLEIRVVNGRLQVNGSPFLLDKLGQKKTL